MGYAAGNKVINAVSGNSALASVMDTADGELATLLGPRDVGLPAGAASSANWTWVPNNNPPRHEDTAAGNYILHVPLPVKSGDYINSVRLLLGGLADGGESPDGEIVIYRAQMLTSTTKSVVATLDDTDPWQLGGAGPILVTYTGLAVTIATGYVYWLELASVGGGGGGDECYYYGGALIGAQIGT
jgi:hypothetical protein